MICPTNLLMPIKHVTFIPSFRVDSWMTFKGKTPYGQQKAEKVKKAKKAKFSPIGFRPPKPKPEQRM